MHHLSRHASKTDIVLRTALSVMRCRNAMPRQRQSSVFGVDVHPGKRPLEERYCKNRATSLYEETWLGIDRTY